MVEHHKEFAPLRRATEQGEVGDTALFLISPLGRGITGEVIYVDGGIQYPGIARFGGVDTTTSLRRRYEISATAIEALTVIRSFA